MFHFLPHFCTIVCQQIRTIWRDSIICCATTGCVCLFFILFGRMLFTKSCFPKSDRWTISKQCANVSYLLNFHIQASLLGTSNMECCVATGLVALDTGTNATAFTDAACKLPTCCCNSVNTVNWFKKNTVRKTNFRYPQRTDNMCPITIISLFEGSTPTWTKAA